MVAMVQLASEMGVKAANTRCPSMVVSIHPGFFCTIWAASAFRPGSASSSSEVALVLMLPRRLASGWEMAIPAELMAKA